MAEAKLLAEWFWVDRWTGSSAFGLSIEARGLYREMLSQAWRRGAKLPNDHEAIRRLTGCTEAEWARCWPFVRVFWLETNEGLINETQSAVYAEAIDRQEKASRRGLRGAQARAQALLKHNSSSAQAQASDLLSPISTKNKISPSPAAPSSARFDAFWKAYPNKTGKDAARKAFDRRKVDDALLALMLEALEQQKRSEQWREQGGRFIPHPTTWLNGGRWMDEGAAVSGPRPVGATRHWTPDDCPHDDEKHYTQHACDHATNMAAFRASRAAS